MLLQILSTLFIIQSFSFLIIKNPIQSVFLLILVFLEASCLLLLLKVEFLAFILVIIYVGAIAVLFIFVVMMLNIKIIERSKRVYKYVPLVILMGFVIFLAFILLIEINFKFINIEQWSMLNWNFSDYLIDYLVFAGIYLYFYFFVYVMILSFLLLVALVGSIILSIDKFLSSVFVVKKQSVLKQVKTVSNNYVLLT